MCYTLDFWYTDSSFCLNTKNSTGSDLNQKEMLEYFTYHQQFKL